MTLTFRQKTRFRSRGFNCRFACFISSFHLFVCDIYAKPVFFAKAIIDHMGLNTFININTLPC